MRKRIEDDIKAIDSLVKETAGVDLKEQAEAHERKLFAYYNTFAGLGFNTATDKHGTIFCTKHQYKLQ